MTRYLFYTFLVLILICCKTRTRDEKLVVDAGSFLDDKQTKEIEKMLTDIDEKRRYHLFLYTVITERNYSQPDYDLYIFDILSKNDSGKNYNVLLYLAYDEKKITIKTGNKAREILTDSLSNIAISRLIPYLSQREYFDGIKSTIKYIDSVFVK